LLNKKIKKLYWEIRITKGRNIFLLARSFFLELMFKFKNVSKSDKKHELCQDLYVSLTSYPPRYKKLSLTLKCLINQSICPDAIILWVTEEDFLLLPANVIKLSNKGLIQIKITTDLGPAKKLIPALIEYPNAFVVTADDDLHYEKNWLEGLVTSWDGSFKTVVAHRIHAIKLNSKGNVSPYLEWDFDKLSNTEVEMNFATCGAGALFPPGCFCDDVTNITNYLNLCHFQDDIWFNWMVKLGKGKIVKSNYDYSLISWTGTDDNGLFNENSGPDSAGNDKCIIKMSEVYGLPFQKYKERNAD
jgi:hypothetical protein